METRDKDKLNQNQNNNTSSTPSNDVNRKTSQDLGRTQSGSNAEFGENIGRSDKFQDEPNRKPQSDSGSMGGGNRSNLESDVNDNDSNVGRH
ncbi:MAG: hypothetical protein JOZ54_14445 [Acidobacteria bacterium]|nr:hypothetical protein [Acidobacteriota bacterium]